MKKYECIVPLSGGKDSQACLKMAVKEFGAPNVLALFCDTQFEHPITYQHIKDTVKLYGVDLHTVTGGSVEEKIGKSVFTSGIGKRYDDNSQGCRVCEI